MSFKTTATFAFVLLSVSLAWQWWRPYPMPEAQEAVPPSLPQFATPSDDLLGYILNHNIWDKDRNKLETRASINNGDRENGASGEEDDAEADKQWELVGVSQQGLESLAIIENDEGISNYKVGDVLPNGARISRIMPFGIQIAISSGENENIYLFGKE
jgi:hypothetical protein